MNAQLAIATCTLLSLGACSADTRIADTGRYLVDRAEFGAMLADKLIELGKVPAASRAMLVDRLKTADFDLRLAADGTFTATQVVLTDRRTYRGTWTRHGTAVVLNQTHDNGAEVADQMTGTLVNGRLALHHDGDQGAMDFVLYHEASPAAPPR